MAMEADLRAQALGLISDAQTADRKDREVYLRQVRGKWVQGGGMQRSLAAWGPCFVKCFQDDYEA